MAVCILCQTRFDLFLFVFAVRTRLKVLVCVSTKRFPRVTQFGCQK